MGGKKVIARHKATIMKLGDGLFLQCCREVAAHYPQLTLEGMTVDNIPMQLVSWPQQLDVMVLPSLYGNIVNDVCTGLVGGAGLVPGANSGHIYAVFETATRQSGKTRADKNVANPTALLLASCIMLGYLTLHFSATPFELQSWHPWRTKTSKLQTLEARVPHRMSFKISWDHISVASYMVSALEAELSSKFLPVPHFTLPLPYSPQSESPASLAEMNS